MSTVLSNSFCLLFLLLKLTYILIIIQHIPIVQSISQYLSPASSPYAILLVFNPLSYPLRVPLNSTHSVGIHSFGQAEN